MCEGEGLEAVVSKYTHAGMRTRARAFTHPHTHTLRHTHTHRHMHTHTNMHCERTLTHTYVCLRVHSDPPVSIITISTPTGGSVDHMRVDILTPSQHASPSS